MSCTGRLTAERAGIEVRSAFSAGPSLLTMLGHAARNLNFPPAASRPGYPQPPLWLNFAVATEMRRVFVAKVVVITGAGAGIGRATAREFAHEQCDIGLIGRDTSRLEHAAAELRDLGVRALAVPADVADAAAVEAAADRVEQEFGPIEVWVNNAMATVFAAVSDTDAAEFRRATEVTYLGTVSAPWRHCAVCGRAGVVRS